MNATTVFISLGCLIAGYAICYLFSKSRDTTPKPQWDKNTWDELQETIMIASALILYGGFEVMCFLNETYASAPHTNSTRIVLVGIISNLFTYKFTKSLPKNGGTP